MSEGRWRITVTAPDWGEDHLTLDAIVAFVDDELDAGPRERATRHAASCRECAAEVVAQTQARVALRTAAGPQLPSSLLSSLRSIPQHADLPAAPADLALSEDGQFVTRARPERPERAAIRTRSTALSAQRATPPAAQTDVVEPAEHVAPAGLDRRTAADHGRRRPVPRGIRLGTGVAVSGLALGALAFGAGGTASSSTPAPPTERGVLGGSVLGPGVVDARLRFGSQSSRGEATLDGRGEVPDGPAALRAIW
ncbi:zf-HC2 domain-containing protein [Pseudonocardia humida]|uniref:Zf-HC2 domain-containing protein n=1 Tax=Pseudonocardia humida TaxID=2800819 RepID=A0ABT1A446_9PSEU|nr:zf-HC2 domain-containing protein [Pseudonocardia humida]MCO1657544.1 zf-HC2 domain-containing protein [Pseudonocardia humida]